MKIILTFCFCLSLYVPANFVQAQVNESPVEDSLARKDSFEEEAGSIYRFDAHYRKRDLVLTTTSAMVLSGVYFYDGTNESITEETVLGLRREDVPKFDRGATYNYSTSAARTSDLLLISSVLIPIIPSIAIPQERVNKLNNMYLYTQVLMFTNTLNLVGKVFAQRRRPYTYNENVSLDERTDQDATASFYSGHAAIAASMFFFSGKMLYDYYPDSKPVKYAVWPVAIAAPAYMGYLRVQAGKHFASDVITGYVLGAATGFIVPWYHHYRREGEREERKMRRKLRSDAKVNFSPFIGISGASGAGLSVRF